MLCEVSQFFYDAKTLNSYRNKDGYAAERNPKLPMYLRTWYLVNFFGLISRLLYIIHSFTFLVSPTFEVPK
jgi:hypothetical protein